MLERKFEIKRNRFFLFTFSFFAIILLGVIVFVWAYKAFGVLGYRVAEIVFFIFAIGISLKHCIGNDKIITLNENYILVSKRFFRKIYDIRKFDKDKISKIIYDEKKNIIKLKLYDSTNFELMNFGYLKEIGIEKFFVVKAELCRYFPDKTHSLQDHFVKKYINENMIPEYIRNLNFSGKCKIIVLLFVESIFVCIPLFSTLYSVFWFLSYLSSTIAEYSILLINKFLFFIAI